MQQFDVIVIGAGAAGLMCAAQAGQGGLRVALLDHSEKLAEKIERPWAIIPLPDGRLLTTHKSGFMQLFDGNGVSIKKITGLPAVDASGQGGLLDVAISNGADRPLVAIRRVCAAGIGVIEEHKFTGQGVVIRADILAEQTQLWIAIPFLHIAKERVIRLVFFDDVDDVFEDTWLADALRDWNRGNITGRKPCRSAEIPPVIDGDLACIAIECFA